MRHASALGPSTLVLAWLAASCGPPAPPDPPVDAFALTYDAVEVLTTGGEWLERDPATLASDPLPFGARTRVSLTIRADGRPDFDGFVQVRVVPGEVVELRSETAEVLRTSVRVTGSAEARVVVEFEGSFGETRLWVEDVGLRPGPAVGSACDDGLDNDGDGLADHPADPGCFMRNDQSEVAGSHAVGVTEVIPFSNPRLSDAQGCGPVPRLERQALTADTGIMIVTAVYVDGFTVSDYAFIRGGCDAATGCCAGGRYAHMYAYNFNTPYGMRVCDRLASVTGTVGDFYGFTELNFPSWEMYDFDGDPSNGITLMREPPSALTPELCPIEAHSLIAEDLRSSEVMESWESGLIDVAAAELPPEEDWVLCDLNGDFEVAYKSEMDVCVPADEANLSETYCTTQAAGYCCEYECNTVCESRACAEIMNYRSYGQYPVRVGGSRVLVDTSNVAGFDPRDLVRSGRTRIDRLTGVLRQFAPLDFPWIIQPRCRQDVYVEGDDRFPDVPIYRRCVPSEETGDYEDPY